MLTPASKVLYEKAHPSVFTTSHTTQLKRTEIADASETEADEEAMAERAELASRPSRPHVRSELQDPTRIYPIVSFEHSQTKLTDISAVESLANSKRVGIKHTRFHTHSTQGNGVGPDPNFSGVLT